MILLDTNVVSEPLRQTPAPQVIEWINAQTLETLFLSAITVAELRSGLALLPQGKRRKGLQDSLERQVLPLFADRTLPFDLSCTPLYAEVIAKAASTGQAISTADAFIAATALTHGLAVATRDTSPFEAAGVTVIDPWRH